MTSLAENLSHVLSKYVTVLTRAEHNSVFANNFQVFGFE